MSKKKNYTLSKFVVDTTLTLLTGGFWLIYVFCRQTNH